MRAMDFVSTGWWRAEVSGFIETHLHVPPPTPHRVQCDMVTPPLYPTASLRLPAV